MEKMKKNIRFGSIFFINLGIKGIIGLIVNPILMIKFDYAISLSITFLIYILIGIFSVKIYDKYRKDCLWIEALKEALHKDQGFPQKNKIIKRILRWTKRNNTILSLSLSWMNTGLVVIFRRPGFYLYNGFTGRSIKLVFLVNSLIINIYWNTVIFVLVPIFILLWDILKEITCWYFLTNY